MNYHQINSFELNKEQYAFFDFFHKNDKIIFICPIYSKKHNPNLIKIKNNSNGLYLKNPKILFFNILYEPICIIIYDFKSENNINEFTVEYKDKKNIYQLVNYNTNNKYKLSLTTLFKDDFELLNTFFNYYDNQGVENYVMYYNGISTEEIKNICNKQNVLLLDWNFRYWNENNVYRHHAQMGQIHHALYKYAKNESEYMIFNDLDEYMHIPDMKLIDIINNNSNYNTFVFKNCWARTLDGSKILNSPKNIRIGHMLYYPDRSKCIHKSDDIVYLGIHRGNKYTLSNPEIHINDSHKLIHFYSWSKPSRIEKTGKDFIF